MSYIDAGILGLAFRNKLNNQLTSLINVKDYGAIGDGVTDDTDAFQDAIDYMATNGGQVVIPSGTYRIDSPISTSTFERDKDCIIIGIGSVLLDFSNMTDVDSAIELGSTVGDDIAITAAMSRGDQTITTAISANEGDVLEILSTDLWGTTVGIYKRELVRVKSATGGTLAVIGGLYDDYNEATTIVRNLNSAKLILNNIKLIGNAAVFQNGLLLRYFSDCDISNVELIDFDNIGISCNGMLEGIISNCNSYSNLREGFGYGISLSDCQNILINKCTINGARHAVTMGSIARSCTVRGCYVYAGIDYDYPMDNHEGCEYITFEGNHVFGGGFYLRGLNTKVLNNFIYVTKGGGAAIGITCYGFGGRVNEYTDIIGNTVVMAGGVNEYAVQIKFWSDNDYVKRLRIADNNFIVDLHVLFCNLDDGDETGNRIGTLIISNNNLETANTHSAIYLSEAVQYDNILISGGRIEAGNGVVVVGAVGSGNLNIDNVIMECADYPISTASSNLVNTFIRNCYLKGEDYLNLLASGNIVLQNNVLEGMIKGGIKVNTGTAIYTHGGNVKISCTGDVEDAAGTTNDGGDF